MNKIRFSDSQQLRFINKSYYAYTPERYDTRLFSDFYFIDRLNTKYTQKIQQNDNLVIQFRTSYTDMEILLYNANNIPYSSTTILGKYIVRTYTDADGVIMNYYNVDIDASILNGIYFISIRFYDGVSTDIQFISETFEVRDEFEKTSLIKFSGSGSIRDGMIWGATQYDISYFQYLRIRARIIDITFGSDRSTFIDSDSELTNLNNYPKSTHVLDIDEIPFYIAEKLSLALQHDYFEINGIQYAIDEDYELTNFKQKQMVSGSIPLRQVEYQNYVNDTILVDINNALNYSLNTDI